MRRVQPGDTVLLVSDKDHRCYIRTVEAGRKLETHRGFIAHDALIGQPIGLRVYTHLGFPYFLLTPTTEELIRYIRRKSQIIFPKDAGYIIMKLGIKPGSSIIEAGMGSGGLCIALATMVGDTGHVFSYEVREDMQQLAVQNLARVNLAGRVTCKLRDITAGFDEVDVDAVFLDVSTPHRFLDQARSALRGGGVLGCIVPTVNQLTEMMEALVTHPGYGFVEASELLLRSFKTLPSRVRPEDQMVGHTGYLIFARAVIQVGYDPDKVMPISNNVAQS
ncbi:MAG: tRNA (adenine-N1)-methyltransferase [Anaerolineae bacterium]|nr:tRNA (adenine-N1)-methyltransferase [Anaerolineae bacterium]